MQTQNASQAIVKKKRGPPKGQGGRPRLYDRKIANEICNMLSDGIPLQQICKRQGFPSWRTIYAWMAKDENLCASIAKAREMGYDAMAEECIAIADDASNDYIEREQKDGSVAVVLNSEHVQRSKLRIDTRLKLLAKWNPKKFGDRIALAGDEKAPLKIEAETQAEKMFAALLANVELKRQEKSSK